MLYNDKGKPASDKEVSSEWGRRRAAKRKTYKSRSMFTETQKARIRRLATLPLEEGGKTQVALAEEFGCSQALISKIVKGER